MSSLVSEHAIDADEVSRTDESRRIAALAECSALSGEEVADVAVTRGPRPTYSIRLADGWSIRMSSRTLYSAAGFRGAVRNGTQERPAGPVEPPYLPPRTWEQRVGCFQVAARVEGASDLEMAVAAFLRKEPRCYLGPDPFTSWPLVRRSKTLTWTVAEYGEAAGVWIVGSAFAHHCVRSGIESLDLSSASFRALLVGNGFLPRELRFKTGAGEGKRTVWRVPDALLAAIGRQGG